MIHLYIGTDREKARGQMARAIAKEKGAEVIRITDAHTADDLRAALQGGGMFGGKRVLVFESICTNTDLCDMFLNFLEPLSTMNEDVFVFEEKPLADIRKKLEKYAADVEKFDAPKKARDTSIFVVADALRNRDKKKLWVSYMQEIAKGNAPEAIHGVLFWAAKDMLLKSDSESPAYARAKRLVALLAELPHEARRRGEDMEYALERFVLSPAC